MQQMIRYLPMAGLCLTLGACTQLGKLQIHARAYLDDQKIEESYKKTAALQAKGENGEDLAVKKETLQILRDTRKRLEKVSGQKFEYAIIDSDSHGHLVMDHDGKEYVTFSLQFLDKHGSDPDILAAAVAHNLAHIADDDTEAAMDHRETGFFVARQIISAALSVVGTPIAGYAVSAALSGAEQAAIAAEEDKVNPIGMQWLIDAGYTPCGYIKMKQADDENSALESPLKFLNAHPGVSSRAKIAQTYIDDNPKIVCPAPVSKPAADKALETPAAPVKAPSPDGS